MARLTAPTGPVGDLVDDYLTSPAVAQMHLYADMAGTQNPATRAAAALRRGDAAVVDASALPHEVAAEFFDPHRLTHARVRLQRGEAPEVVDDTVVPLRQPEPDPDEPTVATQPMEVES